MMLRGHARTGGIRITGYMQDDYYEASTPQGTSEIHAVYTSQEPGTSQETPKHEASKSAGLNYGFMVVVAVVGNLLALITVFFLSLYEQMEFATSVIITFIVNLGVYLVYFAADQYVPNICDKCEHTPRHQ